MKIMPNKENMQYLVLPFSFNHHKFKHNSRYKNVFQKDENDKVSFQ